VNEEIDMVHENRIEDYVQKGKEAACEATKQAEHALESTQDMVRENPLAATLTVFSVGVGLGLLATSILLPPRRKAWYDDYVSEGSRRQIADSVMRMLPESIRSRV